MYILVLNPISHVLIVGLNLIYFSSLPPNRIIYKLLPRDFTRSLLIDARTVDRQKIDKSGIVHLFHSVFYLSSGTTLEFCYTEFA